MWTWLSIRPGIAVAPPASMTTSQPSISAALAVPTRAIRSPSSRMVSPLANGALRSPVTMVPRLTTALRMIRLLSVSCGGGAVGVGVAHSGGAGIEPAAARHAEDHRDLVRQRRVGQAQADRVVMRANVDIVD